MIASARFAFTAYLSIVIAWPAERVKNLCRRGGRHLRFASTNISAFSGTWSSRAWNRPISQVRRTHT